MSANSLYRDNKGRFVNDPARPRDAKGRFGSTKNDVALIVEPIVEDVQIRPKGALDAKIGDKAWLIVTVINGKRLAQSRRFVWDIVAVGGGMVKFMGETLNETHPISGFGKLWGFADETTREGWMDCGEFWKWFEIGVRELFEVFEELWRYSDGSKATYRIGSWRVLKDRQWWHPYVSSDPSNRVWAVEAWGAWVGDRCIADRNHHGQFEVFEDGSTRHYYGNSSDQNRVIDKMNWALRYCGYGTRIKRQ